MARAHHAGIEVIARPHSHHTVHMAGGIEVPPGPQGALAAAATSRRRRVTCRVTLRRDSVCDPCVSCRGVIRLRHGKQENVSSRGSRILARRDGQGSSRVLARDVPPQGRSEGYDLGRDGSAGGEGTQAFRVASRWCRGERVTSRVHPLAETERVSNPPSLEQPGDFFFVSCRHVRQHALRVVARGNTRNVRRKVSRRRDNRPPLPTPVLPLCVFRHNSA